MTPSGGTLAVRLTGSAERRITSIPLAIELPYPSVLMDTEIEPDGYGVTTLSEDASGILVDGRRISMGRGHMRLAIHLLGNPGRVVTLKEASLALSPEIPEPKIQCVKVALCHIRRTLHDNASDMDIETIRGVGMRAVRRTGGRSLDILRPLRNAHGLVERRIRAA